MDDLERTFREGLRDAAARKPALGPIVLGDLTAHPAGLPPRRPARWLAAAAAVAAIAGLGIWVTAQPGHVVPALPASSPTVTAQGEPTLVGTTWVATEIRGHGVVSAGRGDVPYLQFRTSSSVFANDICTSGGGNVILQGDRLSFSGLGSTQRDCGGSRLERQAEAFAGALAAVASVNRSGSTLVFLDSRGETVLRLAAEDRVGGVHVRVRNDTGHDVASAKVTMLDDWGVNVGGLAAGEVSQYRSVSRAFPHVYLTVDHASAPSGFVPPEADYKARAADELKDGRYTYVLYRDRVGRLGVRLEVDR